MIEVCFHTDEETSTPEHWQQARDQCLRYLDVAYLSAFTYTGHSVLPKNLFLNGGYRPEGDIKPPQS